VRQAFTVTGFIEITGRTQDDELVDALRQEIEDLLDGSIVNADDGEHEVEGTLDVQTVDFPA